MDRNLRRLSSPLGQSFCTNATKIFLPFVYRRRALVVVRGLCNGRMSVRSSLCLSVPSMEFFWFGTRCNLNKMSREHLCHSLSVRPSSHVPPLYATLAFYWTVNYPWNSTSVRSSAPAIIIWEGYRVLHGLGWPMGWVGLGQDFSVFGGFGWVGSTTAKVLTIWWHLAVINLCQKLIVYFFPLGLHCELLVLVCLLCVLNISCFWMK